MNSWLKWKLRYLFIYLFFTCIIYNHFMILFIFINIQSFYKKLEDLKIVKSSNDDPELKPIDMAMDEYVKLLPETRQSLITAAATAIATNIDSSSSSSSSSITINDLTPLIKKKP